MIKYFFTLFTILTSRFEWWSSNSCNIGNIGLREKITKTKNTQDHIEKKDHKNEECKIILTDNDSLTMSSSQFTANKNQQKILGKKNQRSRKTK